MVAENSILDLPTGVVAFHMDQTEPKIPAVAVASGNRKFMTIVKVSIISEISQVLTFTSTKI